MITKTLNSSTNTHKFTHAEEGKFERIITNCGVWTHGQMDMGKRKHFCAHRFFSIDYYRLFRL